MSEAAAPDIDVRLAGVSKSYGTVRAVRDLSLSIPRGLFFSLLGPSGCGKTTTLRLVAGFELASEGDVFIRGRNVTQTPPYRRDFSMVFQNFALFPHLTVAENVAFGLRMRRIGGAERASRVAEALRLVKLDGFEGRYPKQLSGGQQQRVALARAIIVRPAVLLLDEPLGALDKSLREEMQVELRQLQRTLGITAIFVTHDQEEALTMSDQVAVMRDGVIEQLGAAAHALRAAGDRVRRRLSRRQQFLRRARPRRARDRRSLVDLGPACLRVDADLAVGATDPSRHSAGEDPARGVANRIRATPRPCRRASARSSIAARRRISISTAPADRS